jgi:hypothetical protein
MGAPQVMSDFDKHRQTLLANDAEEGWASELCRYLSTMQRDVEKETDLIEWWQVRGLFKDLVVVICSSKFRRTMRNYSQHSHVSHLMYFLVSNGNVRRVY